MTYFGETCYLNSLFNISKSIILMLRSSSRDKFTLLYQNSARDVSVGFPSAMLCPSRWEPAWRLHTNSYNLGKTFIRISRTRNIPDLNLGELLCIYTSFHFPDSGLYLSNGFDFYLIYFEWHDTENQQKRFFLETLQTEKREKGRECLQKEPVFLYSAHQFP